MTQSNANPPFTVRATSLDGTHRLRYKLAATIAYFEDLLSVQGMRTQIEQAI
jgi:hypothetical protein